MPSPDHLADIIADVSSSCRATQARAQSRVLTREYDRRLAASGVRSTELAVLVAVGALDPGRPHEIADMLSMDRSTVTRSVGSMETKGWLRVEQESHRTRYVHLTPSGREQIARAYPLWQAAQESASGTGTEAG